MTKKWLKMFEDLKGGSIMSDIIRSSSPVAIQGKIVQYVRSDGLSVFLDGDQELDEIRLKCDKKTVIKAVAIRRCQQVARNYATKHAPELIRSFKVESLSGLLNNNNISFSEVAALSPVIGEGLDREQLSARFIKTEVI